MSMREARFGKWTYLASFVAISVLWAAGGCAQASTSGLYVPNEYIIRTAASASADTVRQAVSRMGGDIVCVLPLADTYLIRMGSGLRRASALDSVSGRATPASRWVIERIQPNLVYRACAIPTDPDWDKMWDMVQINMPLAWNIEKGSSSVTVAVLDTGVSRHPELVNRLVPGYDFIQDDDDANNDIDGHGTHVSGTIAAQGSNGIGMCGVCWDNVKIMPVRVLGDNGGGSSAGLIQGLDWALSHGAQVVNMSLVFRPGYRDDAVHDALARCAAGGVILVAAAGNEATDVSIPAAYDECIAVASTGPFDGIAPYSSFGPGNEVDIAAPGGDSSYGDAFYVWSTTVSWSSDHTTPTFGYAGRPYEGTSMATPHVAGAAALLLSKGVLPSEVRDRLTSTARMPKSGMDRMKYGWGILNVKDALASASIKIVKPARGGTASSIPDFKITLQGILPTSIEVYFDYSDLNDDGIPDNTGETPIIDGGNIGSFLNSSQTAIEFNWSALPRTPLAAGMHTIYVTGIAATGGAQVYDWEAFTVVGKVVSRGIHLFAFPLLLDNRLTNTPSLILPGAKFGVRDSPRSTLTRWIATPRSATDSRPVGYETYVPNRATDRTWVNPYYVLDGLSVPLGGGFYYDNGSLNPLLKGVRTRAAPAGSGYWLILAQDVAIDESFTTLEMDPNFDDSKGYEVQLYEGWNMIGNPYGRSIPWRAALFTYRGQTKGLLDAESAGWVRSSIYGYGGTSVGYIRISDRDMLEPHGGYWLLAQVGGTSGSDSLILSVLP